MYVKTYDEFLNESIINHEKEDFFRKDFDRTFSALIRNFRKEKLNTSTENIAKNFIALNSFMLNVTEKANDNVAENLMATLYSDLFPSASVDYSEWKERLKKNIKESEGVDIDNALELNEDGTTYAFNYAVKGIFTGAMTFAFGIPGLIASFPIKLGYTAVTRRLEREGKWITNENLDKFISKFKDTVYKMTEELDKLVKDTTYTPEDIAKIHEDATAIEKYWTKTANGIHTHLEKANENAFRVVRAYFDVVKDVASETIEGGDKSEIPFEKIEESFNKLGETLSSDAFEDKSTTEELVKTFCIFSLMTESLRKYSNKFDSLNDDVADVYTTLFSEYDGNGKVIRKPDITWNELCDYFSYTIEVAEKTAARKSKTANEAEVNLVGSNLYPSSFISIPNRSEIKKLSKEVKGDMGGAVNSLLFEIALAAIDIFSFGTTPAQKAAAVSRQMTYLAKRYGTYFSENFTTRWLDSLVGNWQSRIVRDKVKKSFASMKGKLSAMKSEFETLAENGNKNALPRLAAVMAAINTLK